MTYLNSSQVIDSGAFSRGGVQLGVEIFGDVFCCGCRVEFLLCGG